MFGGPNSFSGMWRANSPVTVAGTAPDWHRGCDAPGIPFSSCMCCTNRPCGWPYGVADGKLQARNRVKFCGGKKPVKTAATAQFILERLYYIRA